MNKFQIFRLHSTVDMSKMCYFSNKFSKNRQALNALRSQRRLIFDIGDLKVHDLAKFCFFLTDYDVISVTSLLLCHQNTS